MNRRFFHMFVFVLLCGPSYALQPNEKLSDANLEIRAEAIGSELRCLVCQNQSIEESDAPLAHDLRTLLRQRLMAGDSDEAAKQYIVARYGDYVLLQPPVKSSTLILWFGPLLMLLAAAFCANGFYRKPVRMALTALTEEERERLAALDREDEEGE